MDTSSIARWSELFLTQMLNVLNTGVDEQVIRRHTGDAGKLTGGRMAAVELTSVDTGVLQITLQRPEALNALNYSMVLDFLAVLDEVESCADLRAVILTGAGRAFCAGFDLRGYGDDERLASQGRSGVC
jgi:hypothetical protein